MKYSTNSITVHKTESESVQYDNSVFEKLSEDELLKLKTEILQNIASLENVENAFENVLKNENEKYTTDSPNLNTSSHHDTAILTKNDVNLEPVDNIPENPHIFTHKNNKDIPKKQNSSRNKICEIAKMKKYICERIKKYGLYFECPYCDLKRFWKLNDVNVHLKCVHDIVSKTGRKIIRKKCIYKQIEMFRDARKKVLNLPVISQADNIKDNQVISYAHQDLQKTNAFLADISSEKIDNEEQIDIEDKRYANKDLHKMNDFPLVDLTAEKVNTSNKSYADEDVHKQNDFLSVHWTDENIYSENIIDVHKINNFPVVNVTAKKIDIEEKIDTEGTPIISNPSTNLHILDASLVVDLVPDNANIKNGTEAESPQTSPDNIISIHEITKKAISQINDIINTINNSSLNAEQEKIKNLESTELSPNAKNLITEQTYSANNIKEILINKDDSLLNILNECGLQDYKIVDKTDMDAQILEIPIEMVALTKEKFSKEENGREAEHPLTSPDDINRAHENTKKPIIQETEIENNTINNSSLNTEQEHIRNVEATELSPDAIHLTNEKSYSAYINKKSLINKDDSLINILNDCGLQDYKIVDKIDMDSQMLEIPIEMVDLSEEKFCKKKNGTEAENPLTNPDNIISTHENTKKLIIQETDIKNNTYNNSSLNAEPEQNKNVEVTELSSDAINFSTEQTYSATINKKNLIYKDDSLLNVLNECGLQAYQIVDKIDIDVQALEVPIELVNLTEKTISKEQNVIEAENPFTSPDDIISNHENPEKIIIQETVEENKMINNYSLSAVQEFVKNAETTELSAVALTIEQTNSASINTGSLIKKDDSLLNISYECALQNYEIVDEVDNSVVDEVDNGIVDEVDMDIVNEVDKEVLDEVDMEVVDEIDMDVQIIEVPIEIVDLTEETFFEEINGTEAGKKVTTLDNINCNKKVIQGPMTINNDTINLINTNQNYCNVITIGNIDLTKGPTNFAQINKENLKKKQNVIEAENPFTSPDDIISNHENPEKIIIQETVEENKMINNYSLSAVQEFVKNAETTELSAVALTIEQTNSASINTGSLIKKDDSLLNISYECALQNYEIVDEVDNSVVDEVDNGIVDEVDMDIVNEVDKEVLDEVDMEVVDEIDMDVQIIEVPIEIVDLTEETFFEEINGTEAGKKVTTLDNINCNKKVIQGPMTINNDTINLINTNQNYCNVITIGNIDLTKGPTNFAQINKENLKKKNNGKNKSNKIQLQTVTKEKKITYGCKLCRKKTFKKKLFALQHITCKHVESNAYSLLVEKNEIEDDQNKQIDKEFSKINHNKQENNLKANLIDVNAVKNNDRNKKNINNAKNTTHNTQVKKNTSIDKKMIQVKDLLNKVGITNKSKTKITKKTLLNIPTYVFGCCLCPHTTFFSAIEILEHNRLVHSGSAALKTAMPIVPITKLFERSDSSKTKLFLSCLCNYITFDKNFLETEIINKEYKNILMKKNRTHIFSNLACDAESKIIKIYKDEFMYHNRYEVIIDPKANSKKRKPQEDANETDKVVKKRCMDTLSKACNNGLDSVLPVHNSTVSSLPDIVPLVENEISTSSSVLTQQNKKNEKPSLSMYKYTPPTLVGKWGKKQSPTFPKFDWYFWPFEEQ